MTAVMRSKATVALLALLILALVTTAHLVSFVHSGGAYGLSVGTDTHYCSIETAWPAVTCESAS